MMPIPTAQNVSADLHGIAHLQFGRGLFADRCGQLNHCFVLKSSLVVHRKQLYSFIIPSEIFISIGKPSHVQFQLNPDKHIIAIVPADADTTDSFDVPASIYKGDLFAMPSVPFFTDFYRKQFLHTPQEPREQNHTEPPARHNLPLPQGSVPGSDPEVSF